MEHFIEIRVFDSNGNMAKHTVFELLDPDIAASIFEILKSNLELHAKIARFFGPARPAFSKERKR